MSEVSVTVKNQSIRVTTKNERIYVRFLETNTLQTINTGGGGGSGTVVDPGTAVGDLIQVGTVGTPNTYVRIPDVATGNALISGGVGGLWAPGKITEAHQTLADNATHDVSSSMHGYAPKGDGSTTKFLNANGAYSVPAGGSGGDIFLFKRNISQSNTGDAEQIMTDYTFLIAAGTLEANDIIEYELLVSRTGTTSTCTLTVSLNTSQSLTGDTVIALLAIGATQKWNPLTRKIIFKNSLSSQIVFNTSLNGIANDDVQSNSLQTSTTLNGANDLYFQVILDPSVSAIDTFTIEYMVVRIIRN